MKYYQIEIRMNDGHIAKLEVLDIQCMQRTRNIIEECYGTDIANQLSCCGECFLNICEISFVKVLQQLTYYYNVLLS